jgi:transcriptional regulator with XRE-family HTH domain
MSESSKPTDIFPERLRVARESRQLSQSKLAERAGLQVSAVSHFETGNRKPSFDNLRRLADALNVTTDYLLGRVSQMELTKGTADRLHRDYSGLSAEHQEMADEFIKLLSQKSRQKQS